MATLNLTPLEMPQVLGEGRLYNTYGDLVRQFQKFVWRRNSSKQDKTVAKAAFKTLLTCYQLLYNTPGHEIDIVIIACNSAFHPILKEVTEEKGILLKRLGDEETPHLTIVK